MKSSTMLSSMLSGLKCNPHAAVQDSTWLCYVFQMVCHMKMYRHESISPFNTLIISYKINTFSSTHANMQTHTLNIKQKQPTHLNRIKPETRFNTNKQTNLLFIWILNILISEQDYYCQNDSLQF
jgi:hypothetical protein